MGGTEISLLKRCHKACLLACCLHTLVLFASLIALQSAHNIRPSDFRTPNTSLEPLTEENFKAESLQPDFLRASRLSSRHKETELQQLLFPWRDIKICDAARDTPFNENPNPNPRPNHRRAFLETRPPQSIWWLRPWLSEFVDFC